MARPLRFFKKAAVVLAALGLGTGLTVPAAGCARSSGSASPEAQPVGAGEPAALLSVPPLDERAPTVYQTATFALG